MLSKFNKYLTKGTSASLPLPQQEEESNSKQQIQQQAQEHKLDQSQVRPLLHGQREEHGEEQKQDQKQWQIQAQERLQASLKRQRSDQNKQERKEKEEKDREEKEKPQGIAKRASSLYEMVQIKDPATWTVGEVIIWISQKPGLAEIGPTIHKHCIDGYIMMSYLSNNILKDELGVLSYGTRVKFLEEIEKLKYMASKKLYSSERTGCGTDKRNGAYGANIDGFDATSSASTSANKHIRKIDQNHGIEDINDISIESRMYVEDNMPDKIPKEKAISAFAASDFSTSDPLDSRIKIGIGTTKNNLDSKELDPKEWKKMLARKIDAEKKRQKRAELKKDPIKYEEYLRRERERNSRRRAALKLQKGVGNNSRGRSKIRERNSSKQGDINEIKEYGSKYSNGYLEDYYQYSAGESEDDNDRKSLPLAELMKKNMRNDDNGEDMEITSSEGSCYSNNDEACWEEGGYVDKYNATIKVSDNANDKCNESTENSEDKENKENGLCKESEQIQSEKLSAAEKESADCVKDSENMHVDMGDDANEVIKTMEINGKCTTSEGEGEGNNQSEDLEKNEMTVKTEKEPQPVVAAGEQGLAELDNETSKDKTKIEVESMSMSAKSDSENEDLDENSNNGDNDRNEKVEDVSRREQLNVQGIALLG
ncbi:hypothetical protein AX774_g5046 [Zancudomyces culisetae]|uniref:SAM domain-containing protein n=1 Tax=Zancudomyces culisetae TaxID=1213189 RepID=A0A1R1PKL2_ZANCU|nr:hypothetical protein AX774_g5046 [Zancudomyces culisetae]|eukprot:OMH81494.1 hypothetical protein AX774_g5046 [Zancudomyces culisetae]